MDSLLLRIARFERDFGALFRWLASGFCVLAVSTLLYFGNLHFVTRGEFAQYRAENQAILAQINAKLDSLVLTVTQNTTRLQDVQARLHRIESREDKQGPNLSSR